MPFTDGRDVPSRLVQVVVLVGGSDLLEGIHEPFPPETSTVGPERIDHAGLACLPPEEDQASTASIDDRLVVDERTAPLDQAAKE